MKSSSRQITATTSTHIRSATSFNLNFHSSLSSYSLFVLSSQRRPPLCLLSRQSEGSLLLSVLEALLSLLPVENLPDGVDVGGLVVLVLEVEGCAQDQMVRVSAD